MGVTVLPNATARSVVTLWDSGRLLALAWRHRSGCWTLRDDIALLAIEPSKQRRQQHLQRNHS